VTLEVKVSDQLDTISAMNAAKAVTEATFPEARISTYVLSGKVENGKELVTVHFEGVGFSSENPQGMGE
jgi:hypothetical protein